VSLAVVVVVLLLLPWRPATAVGVEEDPAGTPPAFLLWILGLDGGDGDGDLT
jgi:hypothetical protein